MDRINTLEGIYNKALVEYRNGMDKEVERLLKRCIDNEGDAITKELDVENNPIAWTMEDGEVHTICSITLSGYDGELYNDLYIETESECGGSEFDYNTLDTDLMREILDQLTEMITK